MSNHQIDPIEIPDATREPAAYVDALVHTLGDRDPLEVYERTPDEVAELCRHLSDDQWHIPLAEGEWTAAQVVGHILDVDIVYGFRFRLVLTEDNPSYPGYNEKLWSELARPAPQHVVDALQGLRACNVALLRDLADADWTRPGTHGEQGPEAIKIMVEKIAGHDLAHLNQLARTIATAIEMTDSSYNLPGH